MQSLAQNHRVPKRWSLNFSKQLLTDPDLGLLPHQLPSPLLGVRNLGWALPCSPVGGDALAQAKHRANSGRRHRGHGRSRHLQSAGPPLNAASQRCPGVGRSQGAEKGPP